MFPFKIQMIFHSSQQKQKKKPKRLKIIYHKYVHTKLLK